MKIEYRKICNIACIVLMAGLLVLQFTPFWHYGPSGETAVSINGYVWFPLEHTELETVFSEGVGRTIVSTDVVRPPVFLLVVCVAGIILGCLKTEAVLTPVLPLACGCIGLWQYLGNKVFQLGSGWQLHLGLSIALAAVSAVSLYFSLREGVRKWKEKRGSRKK